MEITMAWTEITRLDYLREGLRYASDTTDNEWALIVPWLPQPKRLGRPRKTCLRMIVNALLYMASTGCQWRAIPREFPPVSTVQGYFYRWAQDGFVLLPRRWVVERTFAWLNRCRRLAKDFEATIESAVAWVFVANVRRMTRRIARA
jgi:transposase